MLYSLGLFDIKDIQVGTPLNKKVSGGQRKRLNIALELIREPAILFLMSLLQDYLHGFRKYNGPA